MCGVPPFDAALIAIKNLDADLGIVQRDDCRSRAAYEVTDQSPRPHSPTGFHTNIACTNHADLPHITRHRGKEVGKGGDRGTLGAGQDPVEFPAIRFVKGVSKATFE
jgi:hypothetical protein